MKTAIINNPTIERSKKESIERTEAILSRITDNWYHAWTQKVKDHKFEIMCYVINGKMLFVQIFEHGSVYHFGQTCSIRWDETEKQLTEIYKI